MYLLPVDDRRVILHSSFWIYKRFVCFLNLLESNIGLRECILSLCSNFVGVPYCGQPSKGALYLILICCWLDLESLIVFAQFFQYRQFISIMVAAGFITYRKRSHLCQHCKNFLATRTEFLQAVQYGDAWFVIPPFSLDFGTLSQAFDIVGIPV